MWWGRPHEFLNSSDTLGRPTMHPAFILLALIPFFTRIQYSQGWGRNKNETRQRWVSEIVQESLVDFAPESATNNQCNLQSSLYKKHLSNLTLWAVQMLDSSSLSHSGIVSGNSYSYGDFDQCLGINVPQFDVRGKYCFFQLQFASSSSPFANGTKEKPSIYEEPDPLSSVWEKIERSADPRISYKDTLYLAMCIPSACTSDDLQVSLNQSLIPNFVQNQIDATVTVKNEYCQVNTNIDETPHPTEALIVLLLGGLFVMMAVCATLAHILLYKPDSKEVSKMWIIKFSLILNWNKMFKPEATQEYQFLSGMKVISMFMVIYGHRMFLNYYIPTINPVDQEEDFLGFSLLNFNGPVVVNTFLIVAGFLTFSKVIHDIEKGRGINVPLYIFYRWARIVPTYFAVLAVWSYRSATLPLGPLRNMEGPWRWESCRKNIWTHLLFINNYYNDGIECLIPCWYLALDMQLYIVCVLIGYIMWKLRRTAIVLLSILLVASAIIPGVLTYMNHYNSILKLYLYEVREYWSSDDYLKAYIPTHMRATPYLIGMIVALLLKKLQASEFRFTSIQMTLGGIVSTTVALGTLLVCWIFWIPGREYNVWEHTFYVSLHRILWSGAMSWIILSQLTTGFPKFFICFISANIYVPLNKLTLCALLIHSPVQQYLFIIQRSSSYFHFANIIYDCIGDLVITYSIALVLHLLIEAPLAGLQDFILKKIFKKKK